MTCQGGSSTITLARVTDFQQTDREVIAQDEAMLRSLKSRARAIRGMRMLLARDDPNHFCSFVLRDEKTGAPIIQAPMHKEWHRILDEEDRVVFWSHVEGGKTNQIAIGRVLFDLGRDPTLRIAIISNTSDMAMKITRQIGQYIERSAQLKMVFPHLQPTDDPRLPWKSRALTIRRPGVGSKDPTIQACGVHGNILGSRIDLLVLDDFLDYENTNTPAPRIDVWRWVRSTLFSRLTEHARVIVIGNAWHPDDAMHLMEKQPRFKGYRFPVITKEDTLTWPERWSRKRIGEARLDLGPLEYSRQLLCQARDDTSARFKREWIDKCIDNGKGKQLVERIEFVDPALAPGKEVKDAEEADVTIEEIRQSKEALWRLNGQLPGWVFHGVDLAVSKSDAADLSVIFSLFVNPKGDRRVLNIKSGRWTAPVILDQIRDAHERYGGTFIVENNASQAYIVQMLEDATSIPVVGFTTGRNKARPEFGVEGISVEMANGKWIIPCTKNGKVCDEVSEWIQEMLYYDPREHTGDRLMASWFAREGARRFADPRGARNQVTVRCF